VRHTLINPNYALFMAGSFVSALGSWFQAVALGWLVLELTDSPFVLGLANFAQMAPLFFLGFFGGVAADRTDRRKLLLWGIGVGMVATGALAALSLTGRASVIAVLAVSLVLGLTNVVVWPAWQPFITELVPENRLRDAIAFNSARFNMTRVLGPALAGVLVARVGPAACLAFAATSSAAVLLATWMIRPPLRRRAVALPWLSALAEGVRYVRADRFTFRLLAITGLFGVLVLPYQTFLPAFARDVLNIGAEGLGVLLTAVGAGAVLGAVITGSRLVATRPAWTMALTALLTGLALAIFAAATPECGFPVWVAIGALVVVGFASIAYLTTANATLQVRVPEHLMGRVMGLWVVMNAGTVPLGSLALGGAGERFGLPNVIVMCGLVGVGIGAFALVSRPLDAKTL
jgi:MFS family permease